MTQAPPPPFDPSRPPLIEGFQPGAFQRREEGFADKFLRKTRENPLVPVGCLGTAGVLTYGLICFKRGNTHQSQIMMRARILAQGFTVAALVVGVVVTALKPKK
ncbi:HIG1 domain family member 2A, mitochondrial [Anolis carolinensis]|uniref:HIG1 domain-containing protein n=1 Tax=Anolis carolinensis TaxID=28377 RepID=H9GB82_ANOCA|nr:PREDICTED: HIG1 domain family member 2A, mitochondrial [Anolis carolinensis]|eukprot:XP_003227966.1 PREDICTED: HIG1 domain family member 2A, mitochondrial [Anolis carolinensis]